MTGLPPLRRGWYGAVLGGWVVGVVSDYVVLPEDLPPGDYVLGWRWDAEETAQVWANCTDVIIVPFVRRV